MIIHWLLSTILSEVHSGMNKLMDFFFSNKTIMLFTANVANKCFNIYAKMVCVCV